MDMKIVRMLVALSAVLAATLITPLLYGSGSGAPPEGSGYYLQASPYAPGRFEAAMKPLIIDAPTYFDTPYSISSDKKLPPKSNITLYVCGNRMYVKVNASETLRRALLAKALVLYNEIHPDARVAIEPDAEKVFARSGWIVAPFTGLNEALRYCYSNAGVKKTPGLDVTSRIGDSDFGLWLRALNKVADTYFRRELSCGRGIILIADASTDFSSVRWVTNNLIYNHLPVVSLMTAEMALYQDAAGDGTWGYSLNPRSFRLDYYSTLTFHTVSPDVVKALYDAEPAVAETEDEEEDEEEEPIPEEESEFKEEFNFLSYDTTLVKVGGAFPENAYCIVKHGSSEKRAPLFNDFDHKGQCVTEMLRKLQQPVLIEPLRGVTYGSVMAVISAVRAVNIKDYGIYKVEQIIKE